jgi:hypothetical protein
MSTASTRGSWRWLRSVVEGRNEVMSSAERGRLEEGAEEPDTTLEFNLNRIFTLLAADPSAAAAVLAAGVAAGPATGAGGSLYIEVVAKIPFVRWAACCRHTNGDKTSAAAIAALLAAVEPAGAGCLPVLAVATAIL